MSLCNVVVQFQNLSCHLQTCCGLFILIKRHKKLPQNQENKSDMNVMFLTLKRLTAKFKHNFRSRL